MYSLIATPFLDDYLVLKPGSEEAVRLPAGHFAQLSEAAAGDRPTPGWLIEAARRLWGLELSAGPIAETVVVRSKSEHGFCRATWEINLFCNFGCPHCYLGERPRAGMDRAQKLDVLTILRDAGAVWLQITGGEPLVDMDFAAAYAHAYDLGIMVAISTNASLLWRSDLLELFATRTPYRVTVSVYGSDAETFNKVVDRPAAFGRFHMGVTAGIAAGLPMNLNIVVTNDNAHDLDGMVALAEDWGLPYHVFSNISPTFNGDPSTLLTQSVPHLKARRPFQGCNAGQTFFHVDPHGKATTCKIAREDPIDLVSEGIGGLARLGEISDRLLQRGGGCTGCQIQGTCGTCMPLVRRYREAKAPMDRYCQHRETGEVIINVASTSDPSGDGSGLGAALSASCGGD